jgi:hypothetical protein
MVLVLLAGCQLTAATRLCFESGLVLIQFQVLEGIHLSGFVKPATQGELTHLDIILSGEGPVS